MKRLLRLSRDRLAQTWHNFCGPARERRDSGSGRLHRAAPGPRPIFALLPLLAATSALAALVPTEWEHRQSLNVTAAGLVRVDLPAASFDAAGPQQEDFRVLDPAGHEVAFLLDRPPTPPARTERPATFETRIVDRTTVITVRPKSDEALTSLTLETPHPFFLRAARVEISRAGDGSDWSAIEASGMPLFRQFGAEQLSIPLHGIAPALLRIIIDDSRGPPIPFTGVTLHLDAGPAPALIPIGAQISRRDEYAGETVLTLALDGRHVPLASLTLPANDPLFMRHVTVAVREVNGAISSERIVGSGTIYRVALDGSEARAQLEVPLNFTPLTRELLVHVHNGDSPPLAIEQVQLKRRALDLLFMAPAAGTYTLLSGNAQVTAPRYDLAAFAGEMRAASATTVIPGALETTPNYQPRASLGTAPLPDVPLAGSPLDTKEWTQHRPIELTRAGVQELELDPAALAKSQRDFGDLRVLHAGNQIPYVLEQAALARALTVTPLATPDAKHPSLSVWQLPLPHAGLPLRRLVLTSTTPLFQREFRIYEKLTNQNGGAYEITLASGSWSRTPEPGVPETKIVELSDRSRTGTLWLETDNGDNPAIALGTVQAIYPVVRLIFKTAETDGFALAYGNPLANAPRYDLSLVAVKLLTSPRNAAHLSASAPDAASGKSPFAGINGGFIFWGALALVVVVLLVVVAKLLPKPPAA